MTLLREIELFCRDNSMTASRFGLSAVNDPRLVFDLRNGRELRPTMMKRVRAFLGGGNA